MKFLAVCGFGVGSSMVLKMTLDKVVKEMGIDATVENTDIATAKATDADAYFTSQELLPDLKSSVKNPVYPVKKYMDKEEVGNQVKSYLESVGGDK
ncbi:PTS sugar transporter subunit IIB [Companilactobacillus sp. HBUAS56275]|jgi:Phosphotransferase system, galactitol-specific IIB component|uniref:PTS sugar transporter subunit IIB n=1 Tax=Candidatus Companilactobacillus pullicola TaxID=2838523 RepID=A0A9D1ZPE6_9LACO|nr:PTS sugar transporter subunit IIB [Candidatus Companilactobacillus pullicola]